MRRPIFQPQPAPRLIRSCLLFRWIRFLGDEQFRIAGMQWSLTISSSIYPKVSETSTVGAVFVLGSRHMTTWHDMSTGTVVAETGGREPSALRGDVERLPRSVSWWVIPLPSLKLATRPCSNQWLEDDICFFLARPNGQGRVVSFREGIYIYLYVCILFRSPVFP